MRGARIRLSLILLLAAALYPGDIQGLSPLDPSPSATAIRQWVKDLDHDRFLVREAASRNLLRVGMRAAPVIAADASWKSLEVRRRALGILEILSHSDDAATASAAETALARLVASAGPAAEDARAVLGDRWLSAEDESLLASLLKSFLFDPAGAEYVEVIDCTDQSPEQKRMGWLRQTSAGQRIHFTDGDSIPISPAARVTRVDFVNHCRKLLQHGKRDDGEPSVLVHAAWLYRLGHRMLAARIINPVRDKAEELTRLRHTLADDCYTKAIASFKDREDETAAARLERLLRLYPAESQRFPQAKRLADQLTRTKKQAQPRNVTADGLPAHLATLEQSKQVAFLIDALDSVQGKPSLYGIGDDCIEQDCRVVALLKLGEAAIPALIGALATDNRFTRTVRYPSFGRGTTPHVVAVREVLLPVAQSILRVRYLDPHERGWDCSRTDEDSLKQSAAALQHYWTEFGQLPFEERMMRVLRDPEATSGAMREAAENLARPEKNRLSGFWRSSSHDPGESPGAPRPAILRFTAPTVAEAILAAMDRDLSKAGRRDDSEPSVTDEEIEDDYLFPLIALGDRRIAPELRQRAERAADIHMRRKWALACFHLGSPRPFQALAREFRFGAIKELEDKELTAMVLYFARVSMPEADRALYALAEPKHPLFDTARRAILESGGVSGNPFLEHPSCLRLLGTLLKDDSPTGVTVAITGNAIIWNCRGGCIISNGLPAVLKDPAKRNENAQLLRCDEAAGSLADTVLGFPEYHPLLKDADQRRVAMKELLDRYQDSFKPLTPGQMEHLPESVRYAPLLTPLRRPATAADVRAARAIFHLDGKGKVPQMDLPALGFRKKISEEADPAWALIVQAETGPDGRVLYGLIERHAIRTLAASEFAKVEPLAKVQRKSPPQ